MDKMNRARCPYTETCRKGYCLNDCEAELMDSVGSEFMAPAAMETLLGEPSPAFVWVALALVFVLAMCLWGSQ